MLIHTKYLLSHNIPHGVGYCLLFVVGIAEPLMDNFQ